MVFQKYNQNSKSEHNGFSESGHGVLYYWRIYLPPCKYAGLAFGNSTLIELTTFSKLFKLNRLKL